ncbi:MAG: hypothetical protein ABJA67_03935 [Chthonomonadales bacterium]
MTYPYFDSHIRRINKNLIILNLCFLVAELFVVSYVQSKFVTPRESPVAEQQNAPLDLKPADLLKYTSISSFTNSHIRVKANNAIDVEWAVWNLFVRKAHFDGNRDKINYHLIPLGNRYLLVFPGAPGPQSTFDGKVEPLEDVDRQQVETTYGSRGKQKPNLLPYVLNCLTLPAPGSILKINFSSSLFLFAFLCALPIWNLFRFIQRSRNPLKNPIVKELGKFGRPDEVAGSIQADMLKGKKRFGETNISENWIVVARTFDMLIIPQENLIWVFEKVRGASPWSEIVLEPRTKRTVFTGQYIFYARRKVIQSMIDHIQSLRPWLIIGWTSEISMDMMGRRQDVIAYVDERRKSYLAGTAMPIQHGTSSPRTP